MPGLGAGTSTQAEPFQRRVTESAALSPTAQTSPPGVAETLRSVVEAGPPFWLPPTIQTSSELTAATPRSSPSSSQVGAMLDQALPFQRSISGRGWLKPAAS